MMKPAHTTGSIVLAAVQVAILVVSLAGPALILTETVYQEGRFTLDPWRNILADVGRWWILLRNTAAVSAFTLSICLPAATVLAIALFKTDVRFQRPAIALLLLAAAFPVYVINGFLLGIFSMERWRESALMVGLIHALALTPLATLLIGLSLRSVAAEYEEAALVDGAGTGRLLRHVLRPLARSDLIATGLLVLLWTTTDYSVSDLFLVRTFAEEVYTQYALHGRPAEPALTCLPQMAMIAILLWLLRRHYLTRDESIPLAGRHRTWPLGAWRCSVSLLAITVALSMVLAPCLMMVTRLRDYWKPTLSNGVLGAGVLSRWANLGQIVLSFGPEVRTSITVSICSGIVVALTGLSLAWCMVRLPGWRKIVIVWVILMLAMPAPLLGMGMIRLFNRPGCLGWFYDSPAILVAASVFRFLPVAVILLIPAVKSIPIEHEWSAMVEGAGRWDILRRVIWPQCLPTVSLTFFVTMVLSLGELPCSLLVAPPGYVTVGIRFFSLIHYGLYPDAAILCLLSVTAVCAPWLGLWWLLRRRLHHD